MFYKYGFKLKRIQVNDIFFLGMDCGPAISLVVGNNERPRYELVGAPYSRAQKLAETGSTLISSRTVAHQPAVVGTCQSGVFLVTEEIILALQPRANFEFNDKDAICVAPGLTGYLLNQQSHKTPQQNNSLLPATITYTELASSSSTKRKSILSTSDNSGRCLLTIGSIEENWLTPAGSRSEINAEGKPKSNAAENDASQQLESPESVDAEIIYQLSSSDDDAGHFEDVCVEDCLLNVSPKSQHGNKSDFRLSKNLAKSMHIRNNPLESIINSLHSSFSSDLYSIDLNVETDESELEWITPEMIANNRYRCANYVSNTKI
jgi:hypothetical protein